MKPYKIVAVLGLKPVTLTTDGTEEGTSFKDFSDSDITAFKTSIAHKFPARVGMGGNSVVEMSSYDTPMGVAAALHSIAVGSVLMLRAPKEIRDVIGMSLTSESDSLELEGAIF